MFHHVSKLVLAILFVTSGFHHDSACAFSFVATRSSHGSFGSTGETSDGPITQPPPPPNVDISFSHIHLYVDHVQDASVYKDLEEKLHQLTLKANNQPTQEKQTLYPSSLDKKNVDDFEFVTQNRDVVKQLIAGLGFRVTGYRMPSNSSSRSVLVTSRDAKGVQIIVTSPTKNDNQERVDDDYHHFQAANLDRFFQAHDNRQGIAVLGFKVTSVEDLYLNYKTKHPTLVVGKWTYKEANVLEVFAFYKGDTSDSGVDEGTVLRFMEPRGELNENCLVPGLIPIEATFDDSCHAAYCDHWVSNVVSRTSFLSTLEDTLGFTPKVDFNAGVVAAGEAQIESTVTGNDGSSFLSNNKDVVLKDQRQVYLPINNALSEVGHVHGFLNEIGQGVQHIASRVDNLIEFVQRGNDYRKITGEGFTFLSIPRSYYGILTQNDLTNPANNGILTQNDLTNPANNNGKPLLSDSCAEAVMEACERAEIVSQDAAVDLSLSQQDVSNLLDSALSESLHFQEYNSNKQQVMDCVLRSRYKNLHDLLGNFLTQEQYLGIVRNQILVDVQGQDLLFQIFTCNILQRRAGEEAPFFEFIQRVCSSECNANDDGTSAQLKPGCGGFGIRNFLTLFLSIEVSKAMTQASTAKQDGNHEGYMYAQSMVECFTDQLNESNPILTEISNAMTLEGKCRDEISNSKSDADIQKWRIQMNQAAQDKAAGNAKLMECSTKYKNLMKSIREEYTRQQQRQA